MARRRKRKKVSEMSEEDWEEARRIFGSMSRRARAVDRAKKGKIPKYYDTWKHNPSRYDLPGLDTPGRKGKRGRKGFKPITKKEWRRIYEKCGGTPKENPECWSRELKKRR